MTLPSDTMIWHYCDLAKYVGILSRGLFFALPSALRSSDPWEGCCGEIDLTESLNATVHASPGGVSKWQEARAIRRAKQDNFGVSCWHESQTESVALWRLYAPLGLGVAVRSTPGMVQKALGQRSVEARRIDYGGHHDRQLGDDPIALLSTKRPEFRHEAEVRFLAPLTSDERTMLTEFYSRVASHGRTRKIKPGSKGPLITPWAVSPIQDSTCMARCAPAGVHLPTDAAALVDGVYLAPGCAYSLRRAVLDVTKQFGLSKKVVKESGYDLAPYDAVGFV